MNKFWTRFCSFLIVLVVMISFTGCSLFSDNLDKKYGESIIIASVANNPNLTVNKRELYNVYTEWGYQYVGKMEMNDLLESLTEYVLDQKIVKKMSIEKFGEITTIEKTIALKNAYAAVDKVLRQYVYESLNIDDPNEAEDAKTEEEGAVKYEEYKKSIYSEKYNGETVFTLNLKDYEKPDDISGFSLSQKYIPNVPGIANEKLSRQAMSKIVRSLQNRENGFEELKNSTSYLDTENYLIKSLTKSEQYSLNREIERLVKNNETSLLTSRMNISFNLGITTKKGWEDYLTRGTDIELWKEAVNANKDTWGDDKAFSATDGRSIATNIANDAIDSYKENVRNAITNYELNKPEDMEKDIVSSIENVYYVPQEVANNLFTVSHILVGFSEQQKIKYKEIIAEADKNPSYDPTNALNDLYAETKSNGKNVYEIYNEVKSSLNDSETLQEKYNTFRDKIYKYNSDPGMQNPKFEYVMSVNKDKNGMIAAFTDASIELKNDGVKGAISDIVWGEFGAHIIMYTRDVAEFIWTGDKSMLDRDYEKVIFANQTCYGNKSAFDSLVETFSRSYSNYESSLLRKFKSENQVSIVESEFKKFI